MRKFSKLLSKNAGATHFADSNYFKFLKKCSKANPEIDMTSAISVSPPPSEIMNKISSLVYQDMTKDLPKGFSGGDKETLIITRNFFRRCGISCNIDNVSMHSGILPSISKTYQVLEKKLGKIKVITPTPTFGYYFQQFKDEKIEFETFTTKKEDSFLISPEKLESKIKETESNVLLLCYPNNPTGAYLTKNNAEEIASVIKRNNIFVISDEVFIKNKLSNKDHHSIASIDGILEQSLTLTSASKMMGIPRLRAGVCVGAKEIISEFAIFQGYSSIDQGMLSIALNDSEENTQYLNNDKQKYLSNIDLIKDRIEGLNNVISNQFLDEEKNKIFVKPFIEYPDYSNVYLINFSGLKNKMHGQKIIRTGLDISEWLLQEASVAVVPGECFAFDEEEMLVRIALGHPAEEINRAFDNICHAVEKLRMLPKHFPIENTTTSLIR